MPRLASVGLLFLTSAGALTVPVAPMLAQAAVAAATEAEPHIETMGVGERRIPPDRAVVHLLIETKAADASAAAASNARKVQAVRDTLRRFGVDSAVTTASYNVGPNYEAPRPMDREGPRQEGYVARTLLRVQLGRIDLVGRAVRAGSLRG